VPAAPPDPEPGLTAAAVLAGAPPRPWRLAARLLVVSGDRLLALRAVDPVEPDQGEWWEIPGGGVEPGETTLAAAVRETAEETGYQVPPAAVGPALWHGESTYRWLGRRRWTEMVMHVARVGPLDRVATAWQPEERVTFLDTHWVPLAAVLAADRHWFPDSLPADLPRLLAGERVDAGRTVWS
jgi:8-oxo-dGTP pyrophosphatase MutT (NUDIX family)